MGRDGTVDGRRKGGVEVESDEMVMGIGGGKIKVLRGHSFDFLRYPVAWGGCSRIVRDCSSLSYVLRSLGTMLEAFPEAKERVKGYRHPASGVQ